MPADPSPTPPSTTSSSRTTAPWASPAARRPRAGISRALQEATVGLALETVGTCDALFQLLLAYLKERQQFGVAIGSFQAMKHKMSNMFLALERARSLCYFAVAAINEDTPTRATAVSMAKAASDDCQNLVGRESIQSFGGIGFTWEHDAHLYVKRAATDGALFGGAAAHSLAVAASLGWPPPEARQTGAVRPGESLIAALDLAPHPEGGWYRRTWVAEAEAGHGPPAAPSTTSCCEGEVSAPHRVDATELWHFYDGDPLELAREWPDGTARRAGARARRGGRSGAPGRGGRRRVAVGPPARALRARRGDGDAGLHLRGLRAPSGLAGLSDQAAVRRRRAGGPARAGGAPAAVASHRPGWRAAVASERTIMVAKARGTVQIAGSLSSTAGQPVAPTPKIVSTHGDGRGQAAQDQPAHGADPGEAAPPDPQQQQGAERRGGDGERPSDEHVDGDVEHDEPERRHDDPDGDGR